MIWLWVIYPFADALVQRFTYFKDLSKKQRPNYLMVWTIRAMAAIVHGALVNVQPEPWYQWPALVMFQVGSFWLLFDPFINLLLGNLLSYEGKNSGWLKAVPYWLQAVLSLTMILTGVFGMVKTCLNC